MAKPDLATSAPASATAELADAFAPQPFLVRHFNFLVGSLSIMLFVTAWEVASSLKIINPVFFSAPSRVAEAAYGYFTGNEIWVHLQVSGLEFVTGLALALAVGITVGVLYGWYKWVTAILEPFVSALYATPMVAILPLLILTMGLGSNSKIAVVFLNGLFPVIINTAAGIRATDKGLLDVARAFGANDLQIFLTVAVPNSLPFIIAGTRLALGRALVGVVVGEMYAATRGVGYLISVVGESFQMAKFYSLIILVALVGLACIRAVQAVENRLAAWRPERD